MNPVTIFVKPWRDLSLEDLAAKVVAFGADGVELPVRPGFPVNPENVETALLDAAHIFAARGLRIGSVAADPLPETILAMAALDPPPILRIMARIPDDVVYTRAEQDWIAELRELVPLLEKTGVRIGIQNHDGPFVSNACGVRRILDAVGSDLVGAVWDPAHCALAGERPDYAHDLLKDSLFLVNFKNPEWYRTGIDEMSATTWHRRWVGGREGISSWLGVARLLHEKGYTGDFCLCAEYSDKEIDRLVVSDIRFLDELRRFVQGA